MINLSPQDFIQLTDKPLLIDVRTGFEYKMFRSPDAINLSLPRILMSNNSWLRSWVTPQWFKDLSYHEPIALICLTAHRSPIAAEALIKKGFREVYNIEGGMMEWQKLGFPVVKGNK